jgi:ABC-2 type transport system permease protein
MKRFVAFISKEFKHLLRDYRTVIILFGIPLIQLILFGYVITTEIKNAQIAILDPSHDEISVGVTNKILSSGYFKLEKEIWSGTQIESLFKKGKIKEAVIFENNFGNNFLKTGKASMQIITDASDPNTAGLLENYTRNIVNSYVMEQIPVKANSSISVEHRMFYNEELRSANMFVPGIITLILMIISALMTSISITREKENGTMEILLVSPLQPIQIILGKVVPYMALAFLNSIIIVGVGHFIFGVPVRGSVFLLFALCLLFIFVALSLGIAISTVTRTQQSAMLISMVGLMLPTVLLSGFIFPIENMPLVLQWLSAIMPPRWFLTALKDVMLKGAGFFYIWKEVLFLSIMLFGFIFISVKKFKIRLQ